MFFFVCLYFNLKSSFFNFFEEKFYRKIKFKHSLIPFGWYPGKIFSHIRNLPSRKVARRTAVSLFVWWHVYTSQPGLRLGHCMVCTTCSNEEATQHILLYGGIVCFTSFFLRGCEDDFSVITCSFIEQHRIDCCCVHGAVPSRQS